MGSIRLYSGDDGESHIEEIDPTTHPAWSTLHNAKGIVFRSSPPRTFQRLPHSTQAPVHNHPIR